jgi:hypothetical protein
VSAPIEPRNYVCGVNVVNIEDLRIARGQAERPYTACKHRNLSYDQNERRVYCRDCESDVEPFDAFLMLVERWDAASRSQEQREHAIREAEEHSLVSRASKVMDDEWRKQKTVPLCPHCSIALMPEDVLDKGMRRASKQLTKRKRQQTMEVDND